MQETLRIGQHVVPGIWEHMLPEEFRDFRFTAERFSSCSRCPMVVSDGYNSSYKCCTHIPRVPNFLMGLALRQDDSARRIRKSISDGFALPEGIVITPAQSIATLKQNEAGNFGKTAEVRCGFLDQATGGCGIYHFRNATCSTFFCKNDFGPAGADFWEQVQATVGQVEYALSWWCMQEMGFDPDAYLARFDSLADLLRAGGITSWNWPEEVHRVLWDNWFEREEKFFRGCADLVEKHRSELFTIACRTPLRKPEGFEEAFRAMLPEHLQRELDLDSPRGTPEPVESVWYKLLLMHRNLWLLPDSNDLFRTPEGLKSEPNPLTSALDKHHQSLTWRVSVNGRYHYLTDAEYEFLTAFREPKAVSHEFLDRFSAVDGWSLFIELRNRKLITE